jgi:hypothetical protein
MPSGKNAPRDPGDRANLAALVFVVLLVVGGIWIFSELKSHNDELNCVVSGRTNCGPLSP